MGNFMHNQVTNGCILLHIEQLIPYQLFRIGLIFNLPHKSMQHQ